MKLSFQLWALVTIGGLSLSACSTMRPHESPPSLTEKNPLLLAPHHELNESSVEIEYLLGRDHYRYSAKQKDLSASANTTLGGQILADGPVDREQYNRFLKNAISFVNGNQASPPNDDICRSPFKLTVRLEKVQYKTQGCRSTDKGAVSKLIKEGEFLLLYSKN